MENNLLNYTATKQITDEQAHDLESISLAVAKLENDLAVYKQIKKEYDDMKQKMLEQMEKYGVDKLTLNNGTQIKYVAGIEAQIIETKKFMEHRFAEEHPRLYKNYLQDWHEEKSGRKAYVKITLPKEKV